MLKVTSYPLTRLNTLKYSLQSLWYNHNIADSIENSSIISFPPSLIKSDYSVEAGIASDNFCMQTLMQVCALSEIYSYVHCTPQTPEPKEIGWWIWDKPWLQQKSSISCNVKYLPKTWVIFKQFLFLICCVFMIVWGEVGGRWECTVHMLEAAGGRFAGQGPSIHHVHTMYWLRLSSLKLSPAELPY